MQGFFFIVLCKSIVRSPPFSNIALTEEKMINSPKQKDLNVDVSGLLNVRVMKKNHSLYSLS